MSIQKPPTPARVQRLGSPPRWTERAGAAAVMLIIAGLFLMVRAEPAPVAADAFARTDFHEPVPTQAPAARSGGITASVTMADALEVPGAARNEAASAAAALREAAPARGAGFRPGSPFLAYFDQTDEDAPVTLSGVSIRIDRKTTLTATRRGDGSCFAHLLTARTSVALRRISGEIEARRHDWPGRFDRLQYRGPPPL